MGVAFKQFWALLRYFWSKLELKSYSNSLHPPPWSTSEGGATRQTRISDCIDKLAESCCTKGTRIFMNFLYFLFFLNWFFCFLWIFSELSELFFGAKDLESFSFFSVFYHFFFERREGKGRQQAGDFKHVKHWKFVKDLSKRIPVPSEGWEPTDKKNPVRLLLYEQS